MIVMLYWSAIFLRGEVSDQSFPLDANDMNTSWCSLKHQLNFTLFHLLVS